MYGQNELGEPDQGNVLQVCLGHEHMIGLGSGFFEECRLHSVTSDQPDEDLEVEVLPVAYLRHAGHEWVLGGRNELLALRDDVDQILELLP